MRPIEEWADRKYYRLGRIAHLVPFGNRITLCDQDADDMHGTGDFDEIERAAAMPTCARCIPRERGTHDPDPAVQVWTEAYQPIPREKGI